MSEFEGYFIFDSEALPVGPALDMGTCKDFRVRQGSFKCNT
jgi:hypothetical protein